LAEAGSLSYSGLLQKLNVRTGTLNHHLQKLAPLLDQGEKKLYRLNREGILAYHFIKRTKDLLTTQELPQISRHELPQLVRDYALAFYNLAVRPNQAFREAGNHRIVYSLVALTILLMVYMASLRFGYESLVGLSALLVSWTASAVAFQRVVFRSGFNIASTGLTVALGSLPYIPVVFAGSLGVSENGATILLPSPPFESLWQIGVNQMYSVLFVWRFALLFLGMRELCGLSSSRALTVVLAASFVEAIVSLALSALGAGGLAGLL
jgi:hypothetical protein